MPEIPASAHPPLADPQNCSELEPSGEARVMLAVPFHPTPRETSPSTKIEADAMNRSLDLIKA
jgi:hypothetical protein